MSNQPPGLVLSFEALCKRAWQKTESTGDHSVQPRPKECRVETAFGLLTDVARGSIINASAPVIVGLMAAMTPLDLTEVLKNAPPGDWIALSNDKKRIVATGKTLDETVKAAKQAGEAHPIVLKVPPVGALIV